MTSRSSLEKDVEDVSVGTKPVVESSDLDVAAQLTAGKDVTLDDAEAARIRRKIDLHILPLMCLMFLLQFADKNALGQSAILGLLQDAHINQNQFNLLGTIFYVFYLVASYPQNLALQRFPVAKWMSLNILVWGIALLCHSAAKNFGSLVVCRIFLAICESSIMPAFMIVTGMFYTREEQTLRVGYWFLMDGFAIIALGLLAYGSLHIKTSNFAPWQWLNIIFGGITVIAGVLFLLFFPDSPANAKFLTPDERVKAILRIRVNQTGVENKKFKMDQFVECMKDPKTWMFFFYSAFSQISNSLSNQRGLIVREFGFTALQTTLIGCVDGVVVVISVYLATLFATRWKNGRAYVGALGYCAGILGAVLILTLPRHNRVGLLCSYWVGAGGAFGPFVVAMAWMGSTTAGHTKRICTNAVFMIGYALGNSVGPQPWKSQYQPRNRIPWTIMLVAWIMSGVMLLLTRWYLANENTKREREQHDKTYDDVYISDGASAEKKVDKAFLDLTDGQNRDFRYVL